MIVPLTGYGLSLVLLLAAFLQFIPLDFLVALGAALVLPVASMLWAMWRIQEGIKDAFGAAVLAHAAGVRLIEFKHVDWRIIGSE